MELHDYLETRGSVNELADALSIPAALLSQWKTGVRQVPADRCPDIEQATKGNVRCEEMRPDINWSVLRCAVPPQPTIGKQDREAA